MATAESGPDASTSKDAFGRGTHDRFGSEAEMRWHSSESPTNRKADIAKDCWDVCFVRTEVSCQAIISQSSDGRLVFARRIPLERTHNFQTANGCPK